MFVIIYCKDTVLAPFVFTRPHTHVAIGPARATRIPPTAIGTNKLFALAFSPAPAVRNLKPAYKIIPAATITPTTDTPPKMLLTAWTTFDGNLLAVEANATNLSKLKTKQDSENYKKNQEKEGHK